MQASYEAGDHIGILPENEAEVVSQAAECLGLPLDAVFSLQLPPGNPHQLSLPFSGRSASHSGDHVQDILILSVLRLVSGL